MEKQIKELFVDVSELEAPKPFEEVIQLLKQVKSGEYIRMRHRKKPLPLFQFLQENGFDSCILESASSGNAVFWEIIIWIKDDKPVHDYCTRTF